MNRRARTAALFTSAITVGVGVACGDYDSADSVPADAGTDGVAADTTAAAETGGGPADATPPDAGDRGAPSFDGGACNSSMPLLGFRSLGPFVNTAESVEQAPRLTPDEKKLFLTRFTGANAFIRVYTRPSVQDVWEGGDPLALPSFAVRGAAWPSANADRVYYQELVSVGGGTPAYYRLWRADYDAGTFVTKTPLAGLEAPYKSSIDPYLPPDESVLFFSSNRSGGSFDLYTAPSDHDGGFGMPTPLPVNSTADERSPVISADGKTLYFGSDTGRKASAGSAIYMSTRDSNGNFGAPALIKELAPLFDEPKNFSALPGWISPDDCRLYLATTYDGAYDVFVAWRR